MTRKYRLALAIAVLGAACGFAPVQQAVADDPAPMPALTISSANPSIYGPAVPIDVTVTVPATGDAYIELIPDANEHLTDDTGAELPWRTDKYGRAYVALGADDSDHDGIPGAPLPAQTIHLHLSAVFPVYDGTITGQIIDGATGEGISRQAWGTVVVGQGDMYGQYQAGHNTWYPDSDGIPVTTGVSYPLTQFEDTKLWFATTPTSTHLRLHFSADQLAAAGYTAQQVAGALQVRYAGDGNVPTPTYVDTHWTLGDDGSAWIDFPAQDWTLHPTREAYEALRIKAAWGLPSAHLDGRLQVLGPDGRQYAGDTEPLNIDANYRPASLLGAFYGRDASGTLWRYRGEPYIPTHAYYDIRQVVGGGWNAYDRMTSVAPLKADGTGAMVARDRSGVLWLYAGSGDFTKPFLPRTRVGGGWNVYTSLSGAGDLTGDGRADLLARDRYGVLWLYRGTGSTTAPFAPRTRIGGGWNAYNLTTAGNDLSSDGRPDLIARDTAGALWLYRGTGNAAAPYAARVKVGAGWQGYSHIVSFGDLLVDGHPDILATDAKGVVWYYAGTGDATAPYAPRVAVGTGFGIYSALF